MNNKEKKYFTPEIEDIRVGYEYEYYTHSGWDKGIVEDLHTDRDGYGVGELHFYLEENKIRVPYITKEQIEADGWYKETEKQLGYQKDDVYGNKGRYKVLYGWIDSADEYKNMLSILDEKYLVRYSGQCKDINTFRYICKLLKIN